MVSECKAGRKGCGWRAGDWTNQVIQSGPVAAARQLEANIGDKTAEETRICYASSSTILPYYLSFRVNCCNVLWGDLASEQV